MKRFLALFAILATGLFPTVSAQAGDGWADQIIAAEKASQTPPKERSVRVASLGDTNIGDDEKPARRKRSVETKPEDRPQTKRTAKRSISNDDGGDERPNRRRSLSGGSVNWIAESGCLNGTLRGIIGSLASNYGPVTVNSTCRSRSRNASVGGAPKSYHLQGEAVDFRVGSNVSAVYASLQNNGSVGGLKHYGGGLFHIDTGPRRSW